MVLLEKAIIKQKELTEILDTVEKQLKTPPKGNLCVSKSHGTFQYYMSLEGNPNKRFYLNRKKRNIAAGIAQRDYYKKLLDVLKNNNNALKNFIKTYSPLDLINCYTMLSLARKLLITPLFLSNKEYAQQWQKKEYEHKNPPGVLLGTLWPHGRSGIHNKYDTEDKGIFQNGHNSWQKSDSNNGNR